MNCAINCYLVFITIINGKIAQISKILVFELGTVVEGGHFGGVSDNRPVVLNRYDFPSINWKRPVPGGPILQVDMRWRWWQTKTHGGHAYRFWPERIVKVCRAALTPTGRPSVVPGALRTVSVRRHGCRMERFSVARKHGSSRPPSCRLRSWNSSWRVPEWRVDPFRPTVPRNSTATRPFLSAGFPVVPTNKRHGPDNIYVFCNIWNVRYVPSRTIQATTVRDVH